MPPLKHIKLGVIGIVRVSRTWCCQHILFNYAMTKVAKMFSVSLTIVVNSTLFLLLFLKPLASAALLVSKQDNALNTRVYLLFIICSHLAMAKILHWLWSIATVDQRYWVHCRSVFWALLFGTWEPGCRAFCSYRHSTARDYQTQNSNCIEKVANYYTMTSE